MLLPLLLLAGCGGNVLTQWSTEWVDIQPNPTPLARAEPECRQHAAAPGSSADTFLFCMRRHGWVAMRDPLLD